MNTDEELLTGALDRAAGRITAERLRPLNEPETAPSRRTRARRSIWNARLASAAAAVAVVLVVAAALVVVSRTHQEGAASRETTGTSVPGPAGAPEYYAEVEGSKLNGPHPPGQVAVVVRSTATGAVVARIPTPSIAAAPKAIPFSVAAAPDDRTFYALYANRGRAPADFWIYRFRVTSSGRATRPAAVSGGLVTGQDYLGNVGGFVVSPDGSRLALAVASGHADTEQSGVAGEILAIDLRTGAQVTWRGGMDRPGQVFGIQSLSWTSGGEALAYLGQWCPPRDLSYGSDGGFVCATLSDYQVSRPAGTDVVREIRVTPRGGTLDSGPVLRAPAKSTDPEPVLVDPGGKDLITLRGATTPGVLNVVKVSIATGEVTSVLGSVPRIQPLFNADYLAVDRTGRYVLVWRGGSVTSGLQLHGWVHGGAYHQLAPTLPPEGATIQMTW